MKPLDSLAATIAAMKTADQSRRVAVRAGEPGPNGTTRQYDVLDDAAELLFEPPPDLAAALQEEKRKAARHRAEQLRRPATKGDVRRAVSRESTATGEVLAQLIDRVARLERARAA